MIGIKEFIGYHDPDPEDNRQLVERYVWNEPLMPRIAKCGHSGINITFHDHLADKTYLTVEGHTEEDPEEWSSTGGFHFTKDPYWYHIKFIFDNGAVSEYDLPKNLPELVEEFTIYVKSNYETVPAYNEWAQAAALLDDDMLDI